MSSGPDDISADNFGAGAFAAPDLSPAPLVQWARRVARRWWVVAIVVAGCVGIAGAYIALATPEYHVVARLTASGGAAPTAGAVHEFLLAQAEQFHAPEVSRVATTSPDVKSMRLFQNVGAAGTSSGARAAAETLRESLRTQIESDSDILEVSLDTPHPQDAATVLNAVVDAQLKRSSEQNSSSARSLAELTGVREQREAERSATEKAL